ncbi:MAG TPA: zinc ribbon domain-containing protein, partial [Lachnospiraceae bacterium]|nr:zinc ribbon domain-containing protein [Lachnospiraceae bacterium]
QKSPFKANNLLTSMLYCKKCGARFSGDHGYYTCYSRSKNDRRQIKDPNCSNRKWRIPELNNLVLDRISTMQFENIKSIPSEDATINQEDISKRIHSIQKQIGKLIDLYQVGNLPFEEIQLRIDSLNKERDFLIESKNRLVDLRNISKKNDITLKDKLLHIRNLGSLNEQRLLLCLLIDYINLDDDVVEIHMKI